jgi:hypothetical protein
MPSNAPILKKKKQKDFCFWLPRLRFAVGPVV